MFGIGPQETFVILLLILLLFGADRIPEVARSIGRGMREFRKAANEFQRAIEEEPPARRAAESAAAPSPRLAPGTPGAIPPSRPAIASVEAPALPSGPPPGARPVPRAPAPPPRPPEAPQGPSSMVPPAGSA